MHVQRPSGRNTPRLSSIVYFGASSFFFAVSCLIGVTQTTTGSIYGTVADQSSAIIPNAVVTATQVETGAVHTAESNESGNYVFPTLPPGDYTVSAQVNGFNTQVQKAIHLDSNQNVHVDFALRPGSTTQTVTVTAATTLVDTLDPQLSGTVDQERVQDLPLNGRNAYSLVQTMPGVTNFTSEAAIGDNSGAYFSTNGLRIYYNTFYLDGALDETAFRNSGELVPNPDALQEFRILNSNFDAEFGRSPGAVVNVITSSGTNQYHGVLYDYLRNNIFNAKNYFNTTVTPLKQNQFGSNFGGPIFRQKLNSRAFFFLDYEGLRIRTPVTVASASLVTPTPLEAQGNFSALPSKSWPKQSNGQPYSCNGVQGVICSNLLDPVAQSFLKYVPLANATTGVTPEQNATANVNADQGVGRVDYRLTANHEVSAMLFMSRGTSLAPTAGGNEILDYSGDVDNNDQTNSVVDDVWTISPSALNTVRLFYTRDHSVIGNVFNGAYLSTLGSDAAPASTTLFTQPLFTVSGDFTAGMGGSGPGNYSSWASGISDTFNWTKRNHTVKLGGDFKFVRYAETGIRSSSAAITFTGVVTGNALADLLLGNAATWTQNTSTYHRFHTEDPSLFLQDNWRITHRLTLDLGLRWEVYPPFRGQNNTGTFEPNVQSQRYPTAPLGLLTSGDPGVPDGVMRTSWKDFAPRVGFAVDLFGNGSTALRGGYGVFYSADQEPFVGNIVQQPFAETFTAALTPNLVNPFAPNPDPFPYPTNPSPQKAIFVSGSTILGFSQNAVVPYVQEFNLTLEQQLGQDWGFRASYVGNLTRKAFYLRDANEPAYVPGASDSTAGLNARRPYEPTPSTYVFGQISEETSDGSGSYNSLQATLTKRFSKGFSFLGSYVWSKAMDIAAAEPGTLNLVDDNDPSMDWAKSDLDVPQRFVASYLWTTPEFHNLGILGKQVLSGWQLNGITTLSTGGSVNVTSGVDSNLDGNNNDRPNEVENPILPGGRSRAAKIAEFFNTAAFAQVPTGVPYGNVQRNLLIGPGYVNTDFSAFKSFRMWEKGTLQFRGEIFNLFNNVNLNNPTAVETSKIFGEIGGANSPRIVQLALRYSF
jgi:hypothetical protein